MNYALHEALLLVAEEGLESRWERHRQNSRTLVSGLEALGFRLFPREGRRLPMLNAVWIPEGIDDARARRRLLDEYNIEVGAGLGPVAGKIWRVGLMGESSTRENVMKFLGALEEILYSERRAGRAGVGRIGAGLEAASKIEA
jgi:alanine-glyoxylate transaminase/serine-glyoxylate transaminase/serine-pyruvate transaminase